MRETRSNLGLGALAVVPIACCIGIPLLATTGITAALVAWSAGIVSGAAVLVAGLAAVFGRRRVHLPRPLLSRRRA